MKSFRLALIAGVLAAIGCWHRSTISRAAADPAPAPQSKDLLRQGTRVRQDAGGWAVCFELTRPTDVTIRVVDAGGHVVRHLAGGMVGLEQAAVPFAPGSLRQTVFWDGNDDDGKAVPAGEYTVTIGAGGRAKFDKFILGNPDGFGILGAPNWAYPGAIASGPGGDLYLIEQYGVHYSTLRVFDRHGKFVRCVWPPSLQKSRDVLDPFLASRMTIWPGDVAIWAATDWQGRTVPRSVSHSAFYWYGLRSGAMVVAPDGRIILADAHVTSPMQLLSIDANGLPQNVPGRQPWVENKQRGKYWDLAIGPEGDLYVSDKGYGVVAHLDADTLTPANSFTYQGTEKLGQPTYLLGRPQWQNPGVWDPLWALTVDKQGHIWLANPKQNCIQVYRKDGMFLADFDRVTLAAGERKIKVAETALGANLTSGAVYMNVAVDKQRYLVKLLSPQSPAAVAQMQLPDGAKRLVVDAEANLVWVAVGQHTLLRIEDTGGGFHARTIDGLAQKTLTFPRLMSVDRAGRLYLADASSNYVQSDVEGAAFRRFSWYGAGGHGYSAVDSEGNWYVPVERRRAAQQVWKLSPQGKRLPIGGQEALLLENVKELKGITIAANGDIYVAATTPLGLSQAEKSLASDMMGVDLRGQQYNLSRVDVFGPDGMLKTRAIVRLQGINDVKLDRNGAIYAIEAGTCHGAHKRRAAKLDNKQFTRLNKLMKFAPSGGVRDGPGHRWTYQGLSGVSTYTCAGECPAAQLCIDDDQRIWVPDPAMYNVAAVDAAGNLMFRVGCYGNADCRGGGGDQQVPGTNVVRDPEIPLARPFGIAVWKDYLLISDMYAHRVLRCRLEHAEQQELTVQIGS